MLHLFSSLYASVFKEVEFNVLIVGREASGKSTLLEQIKFMYSATNPPTTDAPVSTAHSAPEHRGNRSPVPAASDGRPSSAAGATSSPSRVGPGGAVRKTSTTASGRSPPSSQETTSDTGDEPPIRPRPAPALPPGTPAPAPAEYLDKRRIRPTVGMNYAKVTHYFAPLAAVVATTPVSARRSGNSELPPPPTRTAAVALHAAPSSARTQLTFWDLGGQVSLRPLWRNYFSQCHGVIFVVSACAYSTPSSPASSSPSQGDANDKDGGGDPASYAEMYAADRQILLALLQEPLLAEVPILIFCNKCDAAGHLSLAAMQDALDLVGIAVQLDFYKNAPTNPNHGTGDVSAEAYQRRERLATSEPTFSGAGGFGKRLSRLVSGSARTGDGVAAGLDWLVSQLLREARVLPTESAS